MVYYPPIGKRKYGPGQWQTLYANVPGGYRQTFNDNVVVWVMIETLDGSKAAYQIAQVPGIHGVFGATSDLGNFSGFANGQNDYDYLITTPTTPRFSQASGRAAFAFRNRPGHMFHLQPELIRHENRWFETSRQVTGRTARTPSIARAAALPTLPQYRRSER